jgi:hypothetical protein
VGFAAAAQGLVEFLKYSVMLGDSRRNALGDLDIFSQQVIHQGLQAIGRPTAFFPQVLCYIPIQVNGYLDFFGGYVKLALFGIGEIVFVFHLTALFK